MTHAPAALTLSEVLRKARPEWNEKTLQKVWKKLRSVDVEDLDDFAALLISGEINSKLYAVGEKRFTSGSLLKLRSVVKRHVREKRGRISEESGVAGGLKGPDVGSGSATEGGTRLPACFQEAEARKNQKRRQELLRLPPYELGPLGIEQWAAEQAEREATAIAAAEERRRWPELGCGSGATGRDGASPGPRTSQHHAARGVRRSPHGLLSSSASCPTLVETTTKSGKEAPYQRERPNFFPKLVPDGPAGGRESQAKRNAARLEKMLLDQDAEASKDEEEQEEAAFSRQSSEQHGRGDAIKRKEESFASGEPGKQKGPSSGRGSAGAAKPRKRSVWGPSSTTSPSSTPSRMRQERALQSPGKAEPEDARVWSRDALSRNKNQHAADRVRKLLDEICMAPESKPRVAGAGGERGVPELPLPGGGMRYDDDALQDLLREADHFVRSVAPPSSAAKRVGETPTPGLTPGSSEKGKWGPRIPSAGHFPPPDTAGGLSLARSLSTPTFATTPIGNAPRSPARGLKGVPEAVLGPRLGRVSALEKGAVFSFGQKQRKEERTKNWIKAYA